MTSRSATMKKHFIISECFSSQTVVPPDLVLLLLFYAYNVKNVHPILVDPAHMKRSFLQPGWASHASKWFHHHSSFLWMFSDDLFLQTNWISSWIKSAGTIQNPPAEDSHPFSLARWCHRSRIYWRQTSTLSIPRIFIQNLEELNKLKH